MNWLAHKINRALFFRTPLGEILSVLHSLYLHLRYSFSDRTPGKDKEKLRYYLVKHCHIVEKGLALPEPRPGFGQPKITGLVSKARGYEQQFGQDDVTHMLRDMLRAYLTFHQENNYALPTGFKSLIETFTAETVPAQKGGLKILQKEYWAQYSLDEFKRFLSCRHSVRDFSLVPVDDEKIKDAIKTSLNTPSVCNRQGWIVHYYNNKEEIKSLLAFQNGNAGFTECIDKLLIVTGNSKAFTRHEHNQLFVDGGLLSMNIMLSLHASGLGSCPLNTCMPFYKEEKLKSRAGIPKHEKLILMIAVGNLKDTFSVAQSKKYTVDEVFRGH